MQTQTTVIWPNGSWFEFGKSKKPFVHMFVTFYANKPKQATPTIAFSIPTLPVCPRVPCSSFRYWPVASFARLLQCACACHRISSSYQLSLLRKCRCHGRYAAARGWPVRKCCSHRLACAAMFHTPLRAPRIGGAGAGAPAQGTVRWWAESCFGR